MVIINDKEKLLCVDFSKLKETDVIEHLFFNEPDDIVYVLKEEKFIGIITLGDFKRNYPEISLAVNKKGKKLVKSENLEADAKILFSNNPKIYKVPVVDENGVLLYEISRSKFKEEFDSLNLYTYYDNINWFYYYTNHMKFKNLCIIDYNSYGEKLLKKINKKFEYKIDIINANDFSRLLAEKYDLIIDFDIIRYKRRKELLRRISKTYTNKYISPSDMEFFRKMSVYYKELNKNGIKFYVFEAPSENKLKYMTDKQKNRIKDNHFWGYYYKNASLYDDEMKEIFGTDEYQKIIDNIFNLPVPVKKGNSLYYEEFRSQFCNCTGGFRITLNKEWDKYTQELNIYGPCAVFGLFVEDKYTISSILQGLLNKSKLTTFNVNNYGIRGSDLKEMFSCMQSKFHKKGDIIILYIMEEEINFFKNLDKNLPVIELSDYFNEQHERVGLFFIDKPIHHNYKANQLIAEKIYQVLLQEYENGKIEIINEKIYLERKNNSNMENLFTFNNELKEYTNKLKLYKTIYNNKENCISGAIVMNCNPFTKGHRYLIEQSAKQVEILFIFVVEEDKSFIKFEDRIELVRKGTEDIKNVVVLPSGKFIISSVTFPEYFQKEDKQEVLIDASLDIEVFAQQIAPALGITVRFVGEEPFDMVTRQYNESMKRILPYYGIELVEIKRKTIGNDEKNVISASNVRTFIKTGQWDKVEQIVPKVTYNFLINNFK